MDKRFGADSPANMSKPEERLLTPASLAVDAILVVLFFALMYWLISPHVPSTDGRMVAFWGAAASACLSTVFWLALQMFRMVLKAQRRRKS